ncbi:MULTISPECIES: YrzI family small protein [Neobacillus]|uniref:YrzI family small protein n=1 Tax=Neobacillus citreus TaxID=2833578 RepID=A0A942SUV8_9BACI|nr:YrzI family small protein [Neobacillus citreus]MCH6266890.1 YrzI family small protein [Neobacillus citreus]
MTLNILFLTITITKRTKSLKEAVQDDYIEKLHDENKNQRISMRNFK